MLPSLGTFIVVLVGACLAVGLVTVLGEKQDKEGKTPMNPTLKTIIIVVIIMICGVFNPLTDFKMRHYLTL
jgi:hypothetical protein